MYLSPCRRRTRWRWQCGRLNWAGSDDFTPKTAGKAVWSGVRQSGRVPERQMASGADSPSPRQQMKKSEVREWESGSWRVWLMQAASKKMKMSGGGES